MNRDTTQNYYDHHAPTYFHATVAVDMSRLYTPFLRLLPPGAHILDAGCGSARDALAFRQLGFTVTAFDASPELATLATAHLGQPVHVLRFEELPWRNEFDAIWACASLLHVPHRSLPDVLRRLSAALKPSGVLYCSFKYGHGEREADGRHFTDLDEPALRALVAEAGEFELLELWQSADQRPERQSERWLNALLRSERSGR